MRIVIRPGHAAALAGACAALRTGAIILVILRYQRIYRAAHSRVVFPAVKVVSQIIRKNLIQAPTVEIILDAISNGQPELAFARHQQQHRAIVLFAVANLPLVQYLIGILLTVQIVEKADCYNDNLPTAGLLQRRVDLADIILCFLREHIGIVRHVKRVGLFDNGRVRKDRQAQQQHQQQAQGRTIQPFHRYSSASGR